MKIILFLLWPILSWGEVKFQEIKNIQSPMNIVFMADTQIHNYLAPPHFFRNLVFDNIVESAIRPPQPDLFSTDLLKWTLNNYGQGNKIVFLGDALDIACKNEWQRFAKIMGQKNLHQGWVMALGNHDSFYYGNTGGSRSNQRGLSKKWWAKSCLEGLDQKIPRNVKEVVLAKDDLIKSYLDSLKDQNEYNPTDFPLTSFDCKERLADKLPFEKDVIMSECSFKSSNKASFLQRVFYSLPTQEDIRFSYKSLLIQEIRLSENIKGILLDTSDFEDGPTFLIGAVNSGKETRISKTRNAGSVGSIQNRQIEIIKKWMAEDKNSYFILMGHHPLNDLTQGSKKLLAALKSPRVGFISAHTHAGHIKNDEILPELNIGSMTDWKPGFVQIEANNQGSELNIAVNRIHFTPELLNCSSGEEMAGTYSHYKNVRGGGKEFFEYTMTTVLASLNNLYENLGKPLPSKFTNDFSCVNIDQKCLQKKFLLTKEVLTFDEEQTAEKRIVAGACQAYWSSREDHLHKH